jgi:hypothetical protein
MVIPASLPPPIAPPGPKPALPAAAAAPLKGGDAAPAEPEGEGSGTGMPARLIHLLKDIMWYPGVPCSFRKRSRLP